MKVKFSKWLEGENIRVEVYKHNKEKTEPLRDVSKKAVNGLVVAVKTQVDSTVYFTNGEGEEYDQEDFELTVKNAQKMSNVNGASFIKFKAISRKELIQKIKNGKFDYETDLIYIYDKDEPIGITGRTVRSLSYYDNDFKGIIGGYVYGKKFVE